MKKIITAITAFVLPSRIAVVVLNILGHKVHSTAKIGFSVLLLKGLYMGENARIGHFNLIKANKMLMRKGAFLKKFNRINGPINLLFNELAALANSNSIYRADSLVNPGLATLKLGKLGQIVSQNKIDLTKSITIGDNTTIGGHGGQLWTHGYVHERHGAGRIRVDGEIIIGNNVYIGSRCTFNPGIYIADGVTVGSNVCISKSLKKAGMYVPQALRYIPQDIDEIRRRLIKLENQTIEEVYEKPVYH